MTRAALLALALAACAPHTVRLHGAGGYGHGVVVAGGLIATVAHVAVEPVSLIHEGGRETRCRVVRRARGRDGIVLLDPLGGGWLLPGAGAEARSVVKGDSGTAVLDANGRVWGLISGTTDTGEVRVIPLPQEGE